MLKGQYIRKRRVEPAVANCNASLPAEGWFPLSRVFFSWSRLSGNGGDYCSSGGISTRSCATLSTHPSRRTERECGKTGWLFSGTTGDVHWSPAEVSAVVAWHRAAAALKTAKKQLVVPPDGVGIILGDFNICGTRRRKVQRVEPDIHRW